MRIKAITLWEPWATLMAYGLKEIETRSWYTKHRGPLAIHAAKRWHDDQEFTIRRRDYADLLAVVDLVGCWQTEALKPRLMAAGKSAELAFGNYAPQRYGFYCQNVRRLKKPLALKGAQGLFWWNVPDGLAKELGLLSR